MVWKLLFEAVFSPGLGQKGKWEVRLSSGGFPRAGYL